jgi:hypothetical protein
MLRIVHELWRETAQDLQEIPPAAGRWDRILDASREKISSLDIPQELKTGVLVAADWVYGDIEQLQAGTLLQLRCKPENVRRLYAQERYRIRGIGYGSGDYGDVPYGPPVIDMAYLYWLLHVSP